MAYLHMPSPDLYRAAIRSSVAIWYTVDATHGGTPVAGATGLRPTGGAVTDTTKPGVRRSLRLDLAPRPGLFDRLAPIGTTLTVAGHVRYTDRTVVDIPMGVFDVDDQSLDEGDGSLSLTAPDKWVRIQRARFLGPAASTPGMKVVDQIAALIRGALGPAEDVVITATSQATVGALVWEKDRDKAIIDLAEAIGAWVFFDRHGVATIADIPKPTVTADWSMDAAGVLTGLTRQRSRTDTCNVVVVESSASDGPYFPTQFVWDADPSSPTYAGEDPRTRPETAGPFGIVPHYFDTPIARTWGEGQQAGYAILARVMGLASQVSGSQAPNPAVDAFDSLDVLPPRERYDLPRSAERHIADTVTHPLTVGPALTVAGRSTRTDRIGVTG